MPIELYDSMMQMLLREFSEICCFSARHATFLAGIY